jgi:hypothetical protein
MLAVVVILQVRSMSTLQSVQPLAHEGTSVPSVVFDLPLPEYLAIKLIKMAPGVRSLAQSLGNQKSEYAERYLKVMVWRYFENDYKHFLSLSLNCKAA